MLIFVGFQKYYFCLLFLLLLHRAQNVVAAGVAVRGVAAGLGA